MIFNKKTHSINKFFINKLNNNSSNNNNINNCNKNNNNNNNNKMVNYNLKAIQQVMDKSKI